MGKIILCEGKSDKKFIEAFLQYLEMKDVTTEHLGNKSAITNPEEFDLIKYENNNPLIIVDADRDDITKLKETIKTAWKVDQNHIFIMPNNKDRGELETLLVKYYNENYPCLKNLISYLKKENQCDDKEIEHLCRAYVKNQNLTNYDFSSPIFETLKQTLIDLFKEKVNA